MVSAGGGYNVTQTGLRSSLFVDSILSVVHGRGRNYKWYSMGIYQNLGFSMFCDYNPKSSLTRKANMSAPMEFRWEQL